MLSYTVVKLLFALLLACVPACIWSYIFYKKQVGKKSMTLITFVTGATFEIPLLFYKYLWQFFPWLNAFQYTHSFKDDLVGFVNFSFVPLDVILTFLIVGVIEESPFPQLLLERLGKVVVYDPLMSRRCIAPATSIFVVLLRFHGMNRLYYLRVLP